MEQKIIKIGGAWRKTAKSGTKYLSGSIKLNRDYKAGESIYFSVFNNKKFKETQPDLTIILSNFESKEKKEEEKVEIKDDDIF